ncbi:MAG TPA: DUF6159 family protein [Candidatus Saccharimonadales bacterium]|nr:DUF6159 family protein [Candidatus Saccharimonadales bacterium]
MSIATVVSVVVLAIAALVGFDNLSVHASPGSMPNWPLLVLGIFLYIVLTIVGNFFSGALIYGATERFRGGDPTVASSIAGVKRKFRPLVAFSLMMATVGLALQILEDRLPFAGQVIAWIGGAAWSIANLFAIPIIVLSEENVRPLQATKGSIQVIRKVWGEGVIAQIGIGVVGFLGILAYFAAIAFVAIIGSVLHVPSFIGVAALILAVIGFLGLIVLLTTLSSIAKAALYYFATTGKAPETFNQELLRTAMTPKKARKIFA